MGVLKRIEYEGVEGLRVGRFNVGYNTTAIVYRIGASIIDTGPPNQWRAVRAFLREKPVDLVLMSHHHEDHAGNGARIKREMKARVLAPADAIERIAKGFPLHLYQRVFWGTPPRFEAEPLPEEIELDGGFRLRAVAAPGHSDDMVCFLEPNRGWLFAADLFIASRIRYLRDDEDLGQEIETLRAILRLEFGTLFCIHRGVVPEGRKALEEKLGHLESLREKARALHAEGRGIPEITRKLLGREDHMRWLTGNHFSKRHLIEGCLADSGF